jgi:putative Mg2+ transporter-C (MgtC) family protein
MRAGRPGCPEFRARCETRRGSHASRGYVFDLLHRTARLGWQFQILGELAIAMLLGATIGFEREFAARPAGLRTHMMVCAAAALLVALGEVMLLRFAAGGHKELVETDPMRIVGAVITGVSFLGAGSIFRRHDTDHIEGLTTAASILLTAGIGMCVALRQWVLAIGGAVMVVLVLRGLVFVERWIAKTRSDADTRKRPST